MMRLKNILSFQGLVAGVPQSIAHGLNWNGRAIIPDTVDLDESGYTVAADATSVTITADPGAPANVHALVESWHSIERAFGAKQTVALSPQPYVTQGASSVVPTPIITPVAAASLDSTAGLYAAQSGFVGNPVKNGVGDWTLQYAVSFNTDLGVVHATVQDQGGSGQRENITVQSIDNTHIRVRTFQAGSSKDQHFWVTIYQFT